MRAKYLYFKSCIEYLGKPKRIGLAFLSSRYGQTSISWRLLTSGLLVYPVSTILKK